MDTWTLGSLPEPICEISPDQNSISTWAIKYNVNRHRLNPIGSPEKIGSAWDKPVRKHEPTWTDETTTQYWFVAHAMLNLFPLPLEKGEVYISIDKHFHVPVNPLPNSPFFVYTARAYTIEDNKIAIVRSDAWAMFGEAIQQLLADIRMKTMIKEKYPEDSALHESQIGMPLQRSYKEYCKHEEKFVWPEMAAEMAAESQGDAVNVADYQVPAPLPQRLIDETAFQGDGSVARGYNVGIPLPQGLMNETALLGYQGDGSGTAGHDVGAALPPEVFMNNPTAGLGYQGNVAKHHTAPLPFHGFINGTAAVGYQGNMTEHQFAPLPFQGFINDGTAGGGHQGYAGGYQSNSTAGYLPPQGPTVGYQSGVTV